MSPLYLQADIEATQTEVCFVPIASDAAWQTI